MIIKIEAMKGLRNTLKFIINSMVSHNWTLFIICYIKTTIQLLRYMINSSHLKTFIITLSNLINSYQNISAFNINHIIKV